MTVHVCHLVLTTPFWTLNPSEYLTCGRLITTSTTGGQETTDSFTTVWLLAACHPHTHTHTHTEQYIYQQYNTVHAVQYSTVRFIEHVTTIDCYKPLLLLQWIQRKTHLHQQPGHTSLLYSPSTVLVTRQLQCQKPTELSFRFQKSHNLNCTVTSDEVLQTITDNLR